jgi:hypothetical protein
MTVGPRAQIDVGFSPARVRAGLQQRELGAARQVLPRRRHGLRGSLWVFSLLVLVLDVRIPAAICSFPRRGDGFFA